MSMSTSPKIDPAILEALSLNPATTTTRMTPHGGGSGFAGTFKLMVTDEGEGEERGEERLFFVKMK